MAKVGKSWKNMRRGNVGSPAKRQRREEEAAKEKGRRCIQAAILILIPGTVSSVAPLYRDCFPNGAHSSQGLKLQH